MNESNQQATGVVRATIQALAAYLLVQATPILDALNVDTVAAEALITAAVMGLYWIVMNWLQNLEIVRNTPALAGILGLLMGGGSSPTYIGYSIDDTAENPPEIASPRPLP